MQSLSILGLKGTEFMITDSAKKFERDGIQKLTKTHGYLDVSCCLWHKIKIIDLVNPNIS